jgi:nitroreductase
MDRSVERKEVAMVRKLLRRFRLAREFYHDYKRMARYSSAVNEGDTQDKLRAMITMASHGIEKGLSLPKPTPGFGKDAVAELVRMMRAYVAAYGPDYAIATAVNVLRAYLAFNTRAGVKLDHLHKDLTVLEGRALNRPPMAIYTTEGGCKTLTRTELIKASRAPFEQFSATRYSVRHFSPQPVDPETIYNAVRIAQKTPSVCNRQPWGVWVVTAPEKIHSLLAIGGGARAFEHEVQAVLVVTSNISCFLSPGERNQVWIDGGMFGMSLIYALHAKGLASCCMNWSKTRAEDVRLRQYMKIPELECIVFLVAVGHPPDEFRVPVSARKPLMDMIHCYDNGRYDYDLLEMTGESR